MVNLIKEISEGLHDGKTFWVCDYRFNNGLNRKPIRHVKPTKVVVTHRGDKTGIYYSNSYFLDKKKVIKLFDNTGYRSYPGTALRVFENEKDCKEYYNKCIEKFIADLEAEKLVVIQKLDAQINNFKLQLEKI